jgi:hypothetical protein
VPPHTLAGAHAALRAGGRPFHDEANLDDVSGFLRGHITGLRRPYDHVAGGDVLVGARRERCAGNAPRFLATQIEATVPAYEEPLTALPAEALARLREAAIAARIDDLMAVVEDIRASHPALAARLAQRVESFDYAGIRALVDG